MNENESYLFHIEQPDAWHRTPDHFWIYGWFVPKNNTIYTDVRAIHRRCSVHGAIGIAAA